MESIERCKNLIIVAAVERYADMHEISVVDAFDRFKRFNMFEILRSQYGVLHTQDLFEGARFADNYIERVSSAAQ
jgi:hypothetical protein